MLRFLPFVFGLLVLIAGRSQASSIVFKPGTDITSGLSQAVASGQNGISANQAVIVLPAGVFYLSGTVNLHGSILKGAGANQTILQFVTDLTFGTSVLTGDANGTFGPFEVDDLSVVGRFSLRNLYPGVSPLRTDGIHLYSNCILRRVNVAYFRAGVLVDGSDHTFDNVTLSNNLDGVTYVTPKSSPSDDLILNCSFMTNSRSGICVGNNSGMSEVAMLGTCVGNEPYAILLGNSSSVSNSEFLESEFQTVGNGDIGDLYQTSAVTGNEFYNCSGWGGRSERRMGNFPASPMVACGLFANNAVFGGATMGPVPGDMIAATGINGNSWIMDPTVLTELSNGQVSAMITSQPSVALGNTLLAGSYPVVPPMDFTNQYTGGDNNGPPTH